MSPQPVPPSERTFQLSKLSHPKRFGAGILPLWTGCLLLVLFLGYSADSHATSREYKLKAGLLYNITKFVEWPEFKDYKSGTRPFSFCVSGRDPFGPNLELMAEQFWNRGIRMEITREVPDRSLNQCHILFISQTAMPRLDTLLAKTRGEPVLLVADSEGVAERGVTINLQVIANKIQFEINPCTAKPRNLWINAELLNLARLVPCDSQNTP